MTDVIAQTGVLDGVFTVCLHGWQPGDEEPCAGRQVMGG